MGAGGGDGDGAVGRGLVGTEGDKANIDENLVLEIAQLLLQQTLHHLEWQRRWRDHRQRGVQRELIRQQGGLDHESAVLRRSREQRKCV